jgi:hypothetical protein
MSLPSLEAHIILEQRLVAYLELLQGSGGPLDAGLPIYPGHGEANLDNIATLSIVYAERSDTQPLWQAGLERIDVRMLVQTQGDDTSLAVHNRRVAAYRTAFDLRNLPLLLAAINATPGFGLSGWIAGTPPMEDAFDKEKARRQCVLRFRATCGIETD